MRKDKTFFFGTYSGLRQREATFLNTAVVPSALDRAGDFSKSRTAPVDPLTRRPFPDGAIPADRFDPTARRILNDYIPQANLAGNFFQAQLPNPFDSDEFVLKVDHALPASHQLTASYFTNAGTNIQGPSGNLPWSTQHYTWRQHNANIGDTWVAGPSIVNQFRLTYVRNFGGRNLMPEISLGDLGSRFQIQGTKALPQIGVSGYFTL